MDEVARSRSALGIGTDRSGREWARDFYVEVVRPLLERSCAGLDHVAARLGGGSDVLGLDDAMSRDHDWGLRLTLLVVEHDLARTAAVLDEQLPHSYRGLPVRFAFSGQQERHHVEVETIEGLLQRHLGVDPRRPMSALDWLSITGQSVLEVSAGPVFHDPEGLLADLRDRLAGYPDDIRRIVLAADWARIGEDLPLMSRAGFTGDELGASLIAARLVSAAVHLAFTVENRWMPYSKWVGSLVAQLDVSASVGPSLAAVLAASGWQQRQAALADALGILRERQDRQAGSAVVPFWDRPFLTVDPAIAEGLLDGVADRALLDPGLLVGSVEQRTELTALLIDPARRRALVTSSEPRSGLS